MGQAYRLQADMPTCQTECVLFLIVTEKTSIYMPGINPRSEMRPRVSFWSQKVIINVHVAITMSFCIDPHNKTYHVFCKGSEQPAIPRSKRMMLSCDTHVTTYYILHTTNLLHGLTMFVGARGLHPGSMSKRILFRKSNTKLT